VPRGDRIAGTASPFRASADSAARSAVRRAVSTFDDPRLCPSVSAGSFRPSRMGWYQSAKVRTASAKLRILSGIVACRILAHNIGTGCRGRCLEESPEHSPQGACATRVRRKTSESQIVPTAHPRRIPPSHRCSVPESSVLRGAGRRGGRVVKKYVTPPPGGTSPAEPLLAGSRSGAASYDRF